MNLISGLHIPDSISAVKSVKILYYLIPRLCNLEHYQTFVCGILVSELFSCLSNKSICDHEQDVIQNLSLIYVIQREMNCTLVKESFCLILAIQQSALLEIEQEMDETPERGKKCAVVRRFLLSFSQVTT